MPSAKALPLPFAPMRQVTTNCIGLPMGFWRSSAATSISSGRMSGIAATPYHAFTMDIAVTRESPVGQDLTEGAESTITDLLHDLARWLYRQLEQEYEYLSSDAAVDEAVLANGYTFTESGRRA